MNYTLRTATPDSSPKPLEIILGDKVIGQVKPTNEKYGSKFHCIIQWPGGGLCGLVQGHGDTAEDSIKNAVRDTLKEARRSISAVTELADKLGVETA